MISFRREKCGSSFRLHRKSCFVSAFAVVDSAPNTSIFGSPFTSGSAESASAVVPATATSNPAPAPITSTESIAPIVG